MKVNDIKEGLKDPKDNPCWKGYHPVGTKKKGGRTVPNCVPKEGVAEGLSKRDQKDVEAIKAAIERLQAQLKHPNADKDAIQQSIAHEKKRLALYGQGVEEMYGKKSSYYNPMDYERDQQNQMDYGKRAFKRAELQHELGHEDDPDFERKLRQQQMDRDRGPWYLKINGKILKSKGEVKVFDWKKGANNYALAILKNKPELQGKIMLTKRAEDDAPTMSESKKEAAPKPRNFVAKNAKMGGAGQHKDKKKAQKQGDVKHKKPVYEAGELKVQKDDDKATVLVNPATGVQTQIDKTNPNAPRLAQDETGKLKLSMPTSGQTGGAEQKPNLVGKDVAVDAAPVEDVHRISAPGSQPGGEITDVNPRSPISGDEDHDEISKLLTQRLRKLAGL